MKSQNFARIIILLFLKCEKDLLMFSRRIRKPSPKSVWAPEKNTMQLTVEMQCSLSLKDLRHYHTTFFSLASRSYTQATNIFWIFLIIYHEYSQSILKQICKQSFLFLLLYFNGLWHWQSLHTTNFAKCTISWPALQENN